MADMKVKYPAASTTTLSLSAATLASNAQGVYLSGRTSEAVDNSSTQDLDHLLSGWVMTSSNTPVASRSINIYAYAPLSVSGGVPTYPDGITGTDALKTMTSANVANSALRFVASITVDATPARTYPFAPVSIASVFGGVLPRFWGIFLAHDTGMALTFAEFSYDRIQGQTV